MTKDLALCIHGSNMNDSHWLSTEKFMDEVVLKLKSKIEKH